MTKNAKEKRAVQIERQSKRSCCYEKIIKNPVDENALNNFKRPAFTAVKRQKIDDN